MSDQQLNEAIQEYLDAESVEEVNALDDAHMEAGTFDALRDASNAALDRLAPPKEEEKESTPAPEQTTDEKIAELTRIQAEMQAKINAFIAEATKAAGAKSAAKRADKKWKLLSTDISWTTKPQVRALMAIINASMSVGDIVYESDLVAAIIENEAVLNTRQGGKKIWDYYKGNTADGFLEHGNFMLVN